jgi:hypothetical protein
VLAVTTADIDRVIDTAKLTPHDLSEVRRQHANKKVSDDLPWLSHRADRLRVDRFGNRFGKSHQNRSLSSCHSDLEDRDLTMTVNPSIAR